MIPAESQTVRYRTWFSNGMDVCDVDTNMEKGGTGSGFSPHELLEAALACCMNMKPRMVAEKHMIRLDDVSVTVCLDRQDPESPVFEYRVEFADSVTQPQREILMASLEKCPVRKTLSKSLRFSQR